jgi:hypothetical protein
MKSAIKLLGALAFSGDYATAETARLPTSAHRFTRDCTSTPPRTALFVLSGFGKLAKPVDGPAGWLAAMVLKTLGVALPTDAALALVKLAGVAELAAGVCIVAGRFVRGLDVYGAAIVLFLLTTFNALLVRERAPRLAVRSTRGARSLRTAPPPHFAAQPARHARR